MRIGLHFLVVAGAIGLNGFIPNTYIANSIVNKTIKINGPRAYRLVVTHPTNHIIIDATQVSNNDDYMQFNTIISKNGNINTSEISVYKDANNMLYLKGRIIGGTRAIVLPMSNDSVSTEEILDESSLELEQIF